MSDNEKLIEDALIDVATSYGDETGTLIPLDRARDAMLAVFEKAHTPTDDEREALLAALHAKGFSGNGEEIGWDEVVIMVDEVPDIVFGVGFRRTEVPEPKCEHGTSLTELCEHVERLVNAEPQGEPSDARVLEGLLGKLAGDGAYTLDFSSAASLHDHIVRLLKHDIAALRAAGGVR